MSIPRFMVWVFSASIVASGASAVYGQNYPAKVIRLVTPGTGGSSDVASRVLVQALTGSLGQQLVIDNQPSGVIPYEMVAKAQADGYTLLVTGNSLWILPLMQNVSYDPVRDFLPICLAGTIPNILVAHPSLPVKSVKELIALAKNNPGQLNYGATGMGSSNHLAGELFKAMAGVNIVLIPYKSGGTLANALLGGEVQLWFGNAASVTPYIKSSRLRALAVTSILPSALVPGLPTVAASGLPGYESSTTVALFAPAKVPASIINRLNYEIVQVLNRAEVKEKFFNAGIEAIVSSPEQLAVTIRSEMTRMGKVIKDAGIKAD